MKIAYTSNSRFPSERAHSIQIVEMCNAFAEQGAQVTLYVNTRPTSVQDSPEQFYGKPIQADIKKIWVPDIVRYGKFFFVCANALFVVGLVQKLRKERADIIYTRNEWIAFFLLFFVDVQQIVWESHEAKFGFIARRVLRKGCRCVCISEGILETYSAAGIARAQMLVAHDGVDASFFEPCITKEESRQNLGIVTDKKVVMYIGGFDVWKGVDTFFKAAALQPDMFFVAVGGTKKQVEEYSKKYKEVLFLGSRPYVSLPQNQQAADILVIPNTAKNVLSEKYTSPLKLFAHLTSRVPLIVSSIASLKAVVSTETVTFFEADSEVSLASTLEDVLKTYDKAMKKAHVAYELSKEYSWKQRARDIIDFIS